MFGVTADETGAESAQLLDEFVSLQKEMFTALELHYRLAHGKRGQTGLFYPLDKMTDCCIIKAKP